MESLKYHWESLRGTRTVNWERKEREKETENRAEKRNKNGLSTKDKNVAETPPLDSVQTLTRWNLITANNNKRIYQEKPAANRGKKNLLRHLAPRNERISFRASRSKSDEITFERQFLLLEGSKELEERLKVGQAKD